MSYDDIRGSWWDDPDENLCNDCGIKLVECSACECCAACCDCDHCGQCGVKFMARCAFDNFYCNDCYSDPNYPFDNEHYEVDQ